MCDKVLICSDRDKLTYFYKIANYISKSYPVLLDAYSAWCSLGNSTYKKLGEH